MPGLLVTLVCLPLPSLVLQHNLQALAVAEATKSDPRFIWTTAALDAAWRDTIRTHASWLAELAAAGSPFPDLFLIDSLQLESIMIDILHAIDQGVASHLVANVFLEIMALKHWGNTHEKQLAGLQACSS